MELSDAPSRDAVRVPARRLGWAALRPAWPGREPRWRVFMVFAPSVKRGADGCGGPICADQVEELRLRPETVGHVSYCRTKGDQRRIAGAATPAEASRYVPPPQIVGTRRSISRRGTGKFCGDQNFGSRAPPHFAVSDTSYSYLPSVFSCRRRLYCSRQTTLDDRNQRYSPAQDCDVYLSRSSSGIVHSLRKLSSSCCCLPSMTMRCW